jgi:hypothetical protein
MAFLRQNYRLAVFAVNPIYTGSATVASQANCSGTFLRRYTNDQDAEDYEDSAKALTVGFDLMAVPATQTTAAGATVTDLQLAALIRKRCENAAGI